MFPDERHQKIVQRIDAMEAEMYALYLRMERLRLDLQREWRVLPSGSRWTDAAHERSEHSASLDASSLRADGRTG